MNILQWKMSSSFSRACRAGGFYPHLENTFTVHSMQILNGMLGFLVLILLAPSFASHVPNLLLFHNLWRAVFCGQVAQIPTILLPFCSYQGCIWPHTQIGSQKDHSWETGLVEERATAASVLIALSGTWYVVAVGMCAALFFCELPKLVL